MNKNRLVVIAYIWNFSSNLIIRGLGLISTLILVRVLSNDDFGIIAIAMMVNGFFDVLANVGINRYLILKKSPSHHEYSNAWSLNIMLKLILASVMCLLSGVFANYFEMPELYSVIIVMALIQIVSSFNNVGLIKLEKELNFSVVNRISIFSKVISFFVTISCALYFENYYALLIGLFFNSVSRCAGSYIFCDFRPRFVLNYDHNMFSASLFLFVRNFFGYSRAQVDTFFVSSQFGKDTTGDYSVSKQFSAMPYGELIGPAMAPIFSALSALKSQKEDLHNKSLQTLFLILLIIFPSSVGLYAIRDEFTLVVLGDKWGHISDALGWLAFMMLVFAIQPVINIIFDAYGKIKESIVIEVFGLSGLIATFIWIAPSTLQGFIEIRIFIALTVIVFMLLYATLLVQFRLLAFSWIVAFLAIPTVMMYWCVSFVGSDGASLFSILLLKVAAGTSSYVAGSYIMLLLQVFVLKSKVIETVVPSKVFKLAKLERFLS
tara:strand:+ start:157 stop:1629 length:1473 start_codon:yes stop_codon:yes gene_type:complete